MTGGRYDLLLPGSGASSPAPSSSLARSRRRKAGSDSVLVGPRPSRPRSRRAPPPGAPPKDTRAGPRRRKLPPTVLVEDVDECRKAVRKLGKADRIAVDCEGMGLSRKGKLCLVQAASADAVYFFDIVGAGDEAGRAMFEKGGLRELLEDPNVWKVMHDCRHDSDALFHQFGVKLGPVIDTQVVFSVLRKARGMPEGLPVSMRTLLKKFAGASEDDLTIKHAIKDEMRGDGDFWLKRPLSDKAMQYARIDVEHLLYVAELLGRYINSADKDGWARVLEGSKEYVAVFRDDEDGPRKAQIQYEQMARVARRQRAKYEKEKRVELHQRTDPMRKFTFDATSVLQALAM